MTAFPRARCWTAGLSFCSALAVLPVPAGANPASASFQVAVRMASPSHSGVCVSEALSEQIQAEFKVTCTSGHFVSMTPNPGRPFVGTHAGAYRFHLLPSVPGMAGLPARPRTTAQEALPDVTTMRVSARRQTSDEQVEILVSF